MKDKIYTIVPTWGLKPSAGKPEPVYGWPKMVPFGITGHLLVNAELLDPPKHEWRTDYYDAKYLHG